MIVRHFLHWVRTAPAGERADATSALARAYLYSDLSADDRLAAEGAMVMLLDDPSPLVRRALAHALARSTEAPPAVIFALAGDQPEIAAIVLEHSPLFLDADLVDIVGLGEPVAQAAIARRMALPGAVAAAIAEVGSAEACLILVENAEAEVAPFSLARIAARFGHLAAVREALFARADLPAPTRQGLVVQFSEQLARLVAARAWIEEGRARRLAREACERATLALAGRCPAGEISALVVHLRETGQLTAGLVLRALLCGNVAFLEEALAELSEVPHARVAALMQDPHRRGFRALYDRAGLPASAFPAFRAALEAMDEVGFQAEPGGTTRLRRRMVERVLTTLAGEAESEIDPLLTLLRRYATEAAREEARLFCDELAA